MTTPQTQAQNAASPWLARLQPGFFGIPLGLIGLTSAWQRLVPLGITVGNPVSFYLFAVALALFVLLLVLWLCKLARHIGVVRNEWRHPVQGPLLALAPMTMLLTIALVAPLLPGLVDLWLALTMAALALVGAMAWQLVARLTSGQIAAELVTPVIYLPPLGGAFIGALTLNALGFAGFAALLAGLGLSAWALLEVRVLNRLFSSPLPPPLRATIGMELAPPAIVALVVASLWPSLPVEVLLVCLGVACGPLLAVLTRWRAWTAVPFSAGFWSFSFPLAALAGATVEAVRRGGWPPGVALAVVALASLVIAYLALRTLMLLLRGRLLPPN